MAGLMGAEEGQCSSQGSFVTVPFPDSPASVNGFTEVGARSVEWRSGAY
jgi:hypothetical protein